MSVLPDRSTFAGEALVAPFPWFGGKRTVAAEVWARLGNVDCYVEPFFGSGAVLLARPHAPRTETVNDKDKFVSNFWRAVAADPEAVARHLDWPVNEADLHSRHWWLLTEGTQRIARCDGDPSHYDAQVAGWWAWGACAWIGSGWCRGNGPWVWDAEAGEWRDRQLPHLGTAGRGINRKLPHLGTAGRGALFAWIEALASRLRRVRVCCGDWSRVCGPSVTYRQGLTGVFLDPPYSDEADRTEGIYAEDCGKVAHEAREWAIAEGRNPLMRIAFAGYDGEHAFPSDWSCWSWKARGGTAIRALVVVMRTPAASACGSPLIACSPAKRTCSARAPRASTTRPRAWSERAVAAFVDTDTDLVAEMERVGCAAIRAARQARATQPREPAQKRRGTPERDQQRAVVAWLRKAGCLVSATVNEAPADDADPDKRARYYMARAKAGVQKGWPDLVVITRGGRVFWIEMKAARGRLTAAQEAVHAEIRARGHIVIVGRDIWSVEAALAEAGVALGAR